MSRHYSLLDKFLISVDQGIRTLAHHLPTPARTNPSHALPESELTREEQRKVAALMRVNHVGEICAQALYQGQALTAKTERVKTSMRQAAQEENDHLAWCQERLDELGSHTSYLNPLWYGGSFLLGSAAGWAGDQWSLGFVAETERQVVAHIDNHLQKIPHSDDKTRSILMQMRIDESQHATLAKEAGAAALPAPIKFVMSCTAKIMTTVAYFV